MRDTTWSCRFYINDRATKAQFEGLKHIFTAGKDGHLANLYIRLWGVKSVERVPLDMHIDGWRHRASFLGKLGVAIGMLKAEVGPTLCGIPNASGIAALADKNWF